jgi:pimeloyl-ACP methyl ester carboxylesterase
MIAKLLAILLCALALVGCGDSTPPAGPSDASTAVVCIGGLGGDQTGTIFEAIEGQCPGVGVYQASPWNGYKADVQEIIDDAAPSKVVLIAHSMGVQRALAIAAFDPRVKAVVAIDGVAYEPTGAPVLTVPTQLPTCKWFSASDATPFVAQRAELIGPRVVRVQVQGAHNDIPHHPAVIAACVQLVQEVSNGP